MAITDKVTGSPAKPGNPRFNHGQNVGIVAFQQGFRRSGELGTFIGPFTDLQS